MRLNGQVSGLSNDLYNVVQQKAKQDTIQEKDIQEIESAILNDGEVSAEDLELVKELFSDKVKISSGDESVTVQKSQFAPGALKALKSLDSRLTKLVGNQHLSQIDQSQQLDNIQSHVKTLEDQISTLQESIQNNGGQTPAQSELEQLKLNNLQKEVQIYQTIFRNLTKIQEIQQQSQADKPSASLNIDESITNQARIQDVQENPDGSKQTLEAKLNNNGAQAGQTLENTREDGTVEKRVRQGSVEVSDGKVKLGASVEEQEEHKAEDGSSTNKQRSASGHVAQDGSFEGKLQDVNKTDDGAGNSQERTRSATLTNEKLTFQRQEIDQNKSPTGIDTTSQSNSSAAIGKDGTIELEQSVENTEVQKPDKDHEFQKKNKTSVQYSSKDGPKLNLEQSQKNRTGSEEKPDSVEEKKRSFSAGKDGVEATQSNEKNYKDPEGQDVKESTATKVKVGPNEVSGSHSRLKEVKNDDRSTSSRSFSFGVEVKVKVNQPVKAKQGGKEIYLVKIDRNFGIDAKGEASKSSGNSSRSGSVGGKIGNNQSLTIPFKSKPEADAYYKDPKAYLEAIDFGAPDLKEFQKDFPIGTKFSTADSAEVEVGASAKIGPFTIGAKVKLGETHSLEVLKPDENHLHLNIKKEDNLAGELSLGAGPVSLSLGAGETLSDEGIILIDMKKAPEIYKKFADSPQKMLQEMIKLKKAGQLPEGVEIKGLIESKTTSSNINVSVAGSGAGISKERVETKTTGADGKVTNSVTGHNVFAGNLVVPILNKKIESFSEDVSITIKHRDGKVKGGSASFKIDSEYLEHISKALGIATETTGVNHEGKTDRKWQVDYKYDDKQIRSIINYFQKGGSVGGVLKYTTRVRDGLEDMRKAIRNAPNTFELYGAIADFIKDTGGIGIRQLNVILKHEGVQEIDATISVDGQKVPNDVQHKRNKHTLKGLNAVIRMEDEIPTKKLKRVKRKTRKMLNEKEKLLTQMNAANNFQELAPELKAEIIENLVSEIKDLKSINKQLNNILSARSLAEAAAARGDTASSKMSVGYSAEQQKVMDMVKDLSKGVDSMEKKLRRQRRHTDKRYDLHYNPDKDKFKDNWIPHERFTGVSVAGFDITGSENKAYARVDKNYADGNTYEKKFHDTAQNLREEIENIAQNIASIENPADADRALRQLEEYNQELQSLYTQADDGLKIAESEMRKIETRHDDFYDFAIRKRKKAFASRNHELDAFSKKYS